ncbi:MAG: hypothetical protein NXI04_26370 [Planctomycetaceae bacterium]|nr:hypothetical protein [Planctomycetaceae bacterium]
MTALYCILLAATLVTTEDFRPVGTLDHELLSESSGIAASRNHPGHVWIHNDSGDEPHLYLVNPRGQLIAIVKLTGAVATDWEDMCSFSIKGTHYLLIGDIGDNDHRRDGDRKPLSRLYLIEEPKVPRANGLPTITHPVRSFIDFTYEDGIFNCEGLAWDPIDKQALVLTKEAPNKCGLYGVPLDMRRKRQQVKADRLASPFLPYVTALDVAPDGSELIVGSMFSGLRVQRAAGQSWKQAFAASAASVDLPGRIQGETICYDPTGQWLYLNSEGRNQPLWKIRVPQ